MPNFTKLGTIETAARPDRNTSHRCYVALLHVHAASLNAKNRKDFNIDMPNGAVAATEVPMTCHHVISWQILRGFWNKLIIDKHYNLARDWLAVCGVAKTETYELKDKINAEDFPDIAESSWNDWDALICWNPINIVRGPGNRSDDPNVGNGTLANTIDFQLAPADAYKNRLAGLTEAGRKMCNFIDSSLGRNKLDADNAIAYLSSIRWGKIMDWDEKFWIIDRNSPRYSQIDANVVHPTWRVRKV